MVAKTVGYTVVMTESRDNPGWIRAALRKQWWTLEHGTRSRPVAETWLYRGELGETDTIGAALRDLLRALEDRLE